jgi:hypothetical protein
MLPLGATWTGICRAIPEHPIQPDGSVLHTLCNLGYARDRCQRFPAGATPDAVRFTIARHEGDSIFLYYVVERDHHPFSHGPLAYCLSRREFIDPPAGDILCRQAQAYIESYLRRKSEASGS